MNAVEAQSPVQKALGQILILLEEARNIEATFGPDTPEWVADYAKRLVPETIFTLETEANRLDNLLDEKMSIDPESQKAKPDWKVFMNKLRLVGNLATKPITSETLSQAATVGDTYIVKELLKNPSVNPTAWSNAAIRRAAENNEVDVIKLLLQDGRASPTSVPIQNSQEVMLVLLNDPRVNPTANGNSAMHYACEHNYTEVVRLLLRDPRVDPNLIARFTNSPLEVALARDNFETALVLVQDMRVTIDDKSKDTIIRMASEKLYNEAKMRMIRQMVTGRGKHHTGAANVRQRAIQRAQQAANNLIALEQREAGARGGAQRKTRRRINRRSTHRKRSKHIL